MHYKKSKSYSGKRKAIPDKNMEMQEKMEYIGKDKYVRKYKLTLILQTTIIIVGRF